MNKLKDSGIHIKWSLFMDVIRDPYFHRPIVAAAKDNDLHAFVYMLNDALL